MTQKTKCLIIDDELNAIFLMQDHISKIPDLEITGEFTDSLLAVNFLCHNQVDLIFLDIEMPNLTGLELIKSLTHPPKVIIITAHRDFALEGFELGVVDYLLKPVVFNRFLKSISRFNHYFKTEGTHSKQLKLSNPWETPLFFKEGAKTHILQMKDILYIEGMNEYVKIYLSGKHIILKRSLKSLEELLPEDVFLRVHRSYIISLKHIRSFTNFQLDIADKIIPLGSKYRLKALEFLGSI